MSSKAKKLLMNKIYKTTLSVLVGSISCASFAQQYQQPTTNLPGQPSPPAPQSPLNNLNPPVQVATNPFGAVKPQEATPATIGYSNGQNNVEKGQQLNIPQNYEKNAQFQNPAVAQQQAMGVPTSPPTGLPQDPNYTPEYSSSGSSQRRQNASQDGAEAMLTILNTPNSRIRDLNRDLYDKGRVINEGPVTAPRAANGVVVAHISPGSTSPVIRLAKNRTSTIIVTDMTGQPWPILNFDGLSTEDFTVKRLDAPAPDGYVLSITPKGAFVSGNLVLILKGLPTPLNVEFVSAQRNVDTTTEIRVQAKGPNAKFSSIALPQAADTALLSVLQGVAPQTAKELKVSSPAVQAWLAKDGSMYVRTRYKIMSPAFENVTSSPDGTYAYKMVPVPVVLYKVADGRFGEFSVDGF